jgi:L-fucose mutarotase/ribose pyranase (RbsD/FucU family)
VTKELFAALSDAGQGDKIVLASSGFPAVSTAQQSNATLIRIDSETVPTILEEIMKFIKVIKPLYALLPLQSLFRS